MNGEVVVCGGGGGGGVGMMKTSKVSKAGPSGWSAGHHHLHHHHHHHDPWIQPPVTTPASLSPKEPPTNTSMDSGVAGLRDTPVHTPAPIHHHNNTTTATITTTTTTITTNTNSNNNNNNNNMGGGKGNNNNNNNNNNNEDYDVPKFIVDHSTRATYMKGRFLGKGGFARVHEVTDLITNMTYAGKIIPKCRITKPHHKEKIAREIEVHRHLRHQHVVRFHHYFEDDANVYIILENCARRSLVHVLKHRRTLTEPEVRYYMRQLAEGVAYVHQQHVIHRDLKLGNMFLTEDMSVKIGDFGLATRVDDNRNVTICGTPNYIAPEVLNKLGHSYDADIWAMGCIMYALLVGQPPFETDSLKETYSRITTNKYVIPPLVSDAARNLIRRFLHPDPNARPRLDQLLSHEFFTSGVVPTSLPPSACTQPPKFGLEVIGKSVSMPEQQLQHPPSLPQSQSQQQHPLCQDIKKITSSVSTLRIPNQKPQTDKISILEGGLGLGSPPPTRPTNTAVPKEENRKKDSGGTLSSCLRQKLSSVICTTDNKASTGTVVTAKKRDVTSGTLYNLLASCLDNMPDDMSTNPAVLNHTPLFISKWIDYSNKYGFGYQLSDNCVGVFFNDLTRISISPDKSRVEFTDSTGRLVVHQAGSLPAWLQERYQLLRYFATYMEENLTEAGDVRSSRAVVGRGNVIPHVRRWDRTPKSIIMQLSNGTFQINFFKDHTKIVIAGERSDVSIMFISSDRQSFTYRLSQLAEVGCDAMVRERLVYALSCLRQYAELDGEEV
ncbi:serine/threonine-protein kinase PLK1-like isoform X2 [Portunus trituberculatus]|uniref:serine/threonine-protein kinase PLK1-like isoform X2 n=1 Tax=Portunus trituberculatus TaxID=210409 RepID=UPI001E1CFCDE|nr:serine/threonine-protein kinase PLK1-like isoform X2 [Portunus trituberculatus]